MNKLNVYKVIPNLFTISSFILGFTAIKIAVFGNTQGAIILILISAFLDVFDGGIARKLGVDGKFGAELDSFADMVSFGIATSIIVLFAIDPKDTFLFVASCFFSISAMLRLTRFNLTANTTSYKFFFTGIPTPAGFMLGIFPLCLSYSFNNIEITSTMYSFYLIIIGFGMLSILPTPSFKGLKIDAKYFLLYLGLISLVLVGLVNYLWLSLCILSSLYIISIIITSTIAFKRKLT